MQKRATRALIHLAAAGAAITLGWAVAATSFGEQLELRTYDYRFKLKDTAANDAPVTILAIDDASIAQIPDPMMLWHKHFAEVLNALAVGEAGAVGIDVVFAAPSSSRIACAPAASSSRRRPSRWH
jgi:CHASE2 domain-containing sensor protein